MKNLNQLFEEVLHESNSLYKILQLHGYLTGVNGLPKMDYIEASNFIAECLEEIRDSGDIDYCIEKLKKKPSDW